MVLPPSKAKGANTKKFPSIEIFIMRDKRHSAPRRIATLSTSRRVLEPGLGINKKEGNNQSQYAPADK